MRLTALSPAIVDFFETRIRQVRYARRRALLRRSLDSLPRYIARDIGLDCGYGEDIRYLDD